MMGPRPLVRNVLVNFAGQGAPLIAVAVSMPLIATGFGLERLGLLNLAWVLLGSFGLLDLGVGRSLTQLVAARLAAGNLVGLPGLFAGGCGMLFGVGLIASAAVAFSATWIASRALDVSPPLRVEAINSLYLLAAGLPFMMASSAARGFLEAHQRFGLVNAVRAPLGVLTYAGPVLVLPFSHSVTAAVAVITIARVAACAIYSVLCWSLFPTGRTTSLFNRADAGDLLSSGLWMTSTNVIASAITYADRFVLGVVASVATLAYYATPEEVIGRVTVFPATIAAVMFPVFSAAWARQSGEVTRLFEKMSLYSHLTLFPLTFLGAASAPLWLSLWMGTDFAARSTTVTQWFCLGVFANGLAVTPVTFLQAAGRADLTAKLQAYELPVYLVVLWYSSAWFGMTGAAVTWAARSALDAILMFGASSRLLPHGGRVVKRQGQVFGTAFVGLLLINLSPAASWRVVIVAVFVTWFVFSLPRLVDRKDWHSARLLWKPWKRQRRLQ